MAEPMIAEIKMVPYNFAPRLFVYCTGGLLPISDNTALFSLIGTTYGGDGRTTMGVPNLVGKTPIHWGTAPGLSPRLYGSFGGQVHVNLDYRHLPSHTHEIYFAQTASTDTNPTDKFMGMAEPVSQGVPVKLYDSTIDETLIVNMSSQALSTSGQSIAHENRQPYQVVSYVMALDGIYPSRN